MNDSESMLAQAVESLSTQNWLDAESLCRQVLTDEPENARAWHLRGIVCGQQDDLARAVEYLEKAVHCRPDAAIYHFNLGLAYRKRQQLEKAVECYRQAVQRDPDLFEARNNLGNALVELGKNDAAIETFQDYVTRYPENSEAQQHILAALSGDNVPTRCNDHYVRGVFDKEFARSFDQQLDHLQYRGPKLMMAALDLLDEIPTDAVVLDAGCGTGLSADFLRPICSRLVGLDLSDDMLQEARNRHLYDELIEDELCRHLQTATDCYDLVICSDTLCYFGKIDEVMTAVYESLRTHGIFVFTVEGQGDAATQQTQPYCLKMSGRYGHSESYVRQAVATAGLRLDRLVRETLRSESGQPLQGLVITAVRDK